MCGEREEKGRKTKQDFDYFGIRKSNLLMWNLVRQKQYTNKHSSGISLTLLYSLFICEK